MVFWAFVAIVVGALAYVRFAPSDAARWHVASKFTADADFPGGAVRVVGAGATGLADLDAVARATPRTTVLAGSVADSMVTYVTRSGVFGFPDYTTVQQVGDQLILNARLRFGRSDFGVNRGRLDRWIGAVQTR